MIEKLSSYLGERLSMELPGEKAHVEMAPIHRPLPQEARKWRDTRFSGVLLLLYPKDGKVYTALMLRTDNGGVHSAQISFPGGRVEDGDKDIQHTALREAHEELGIEPERIEVIGSLSELYIPPSKALVTPIVAVSDSRPDFVLEKMEVQELIEADVFDLFTDKYFRKTEVVTSKYLMKEVPAFVYADYIIWGATAMILNELKWILQDLNE